mmetsp:Transcript_44773/g.97361  ORF Transcript_44773/g.97361 Transcript_44773/m.97361 type:complete len:279 (+) Transcript_44773:820-1656(+)
MGDGLPPDVEIILEGPWHVVLRRENGVDGQVPRPVHLRGRHPIAPRRSSQVVLLLEQFRVGAHAHREIPRRKPRAPRGHVPRRRPRSRQPTGVPRVGKRRHGVRGATLGVVGASVVERVPIDDFDAPLGRVGWAAGGGLGDGEGHGVGGDGGGAEGVGGAGHGDGPGDGGPVVREEARASTVADLVGLAGVPGEDLDIPGRGLRRRLSRLGVADGGVRTPNPVHSHRHRCGAAAGGGDDLNALLLRCDREAGAPDGDGVVVIGLGGGLDRGQDQVHSS